MSNPGPLSLTPEQAERLREATERAAVAAQKWVSVFADSVADSLEKITVALNDAAVKLEQARTAEGAKDTAREDPQDSPDDDDDPFWDDLTWTTRG